MAKLHLDALLRLVDVAINPAIFKKISAATAILPKNIQIFNQQFDVTNNKLTTVNKNMTKLTQATQGVGQSLNTANAFATRFLQRMAQFAVLLPVFVNLNRAIQGGITFIHDFERELVKVVRVDPKNLRDRMQEIGESVLVIAKNFGATGSEVLGTVKTFVQAGDSIAEALDKARVATLATQVTTLDLEGAQELLIATGKQFEEQGLSNIAILDKIAAAEDASASNAQDFADAFKTGGNALAFASKSFEFSVGLIAALREQTRKTGNEIGTFSKTLITRLFAAGESRTALENLGVVVENLDGTFRPLEVVLRDTKVAFDGLTEAQQASAAKAIAGVRQFEGFLATLKSLDKASEVVTAQQKSQGTAQERLSLVQETLAFKVNQTIASLQELANTAGGAGLLDTFKKLVDFAGLIANSLQSAAKFGDELGINLAPLLAVGGVKFGQKIFGGQNAAGGQGAVAANRSLLQLASSAKTGSAAFQQFTARIQAGPKVIGVQGAPTKNQFLGNQFSGGAIAGLIISAGLANKALDFFAEKLRQSGEISANATADLLGDLGEAANTAASFALLGGKAAALAGGFTLAIDRLLALNKAFEEFKKAQEDESKELKKEESFSALPANTAGGLDKFIEIFGQQLANSSGKLSGEFFANVKRDFGAFAKSNPVFSNLDVDQIFRPEVIRAIANTRDGMEEVRAALARGENGLREFAAAIDPKAVTANAKKSFDELYESVDELADSLKVVEKFKGLAEAEAAIAKSRLELNKISEQAVTLFQSDLKQKQDELALLEKLPKATEAYVRQLQQFALSKPNEVGAATGSGKFGSAAFISQLDDAFKKIGSSAFETSKFINALAPSQQEFATKYIQALQEQQNSELEIERARLDVRKAQAQQEFELQKGLRDAATESAQNILELQSQLIDLGLSADSSSADLAKLQKLTLEQFQDIKSGRSNLSPELQNAVMAGGGNDVARAEREISAESMKAAAEIDALNKQLQEAEAGLARLKDGFDQTTGKSETDLLIQSSEIRNRIREREAQKDIELAKLGIARAKALSDAEEEAAKKSKALEDALRNLTKKTNDTQRAFADLVNQKLEDFAQRDADAQSTLKDAQQAVLSSTEELADAYEGLDAAILQFNDGMAQAQIESNLFGVQISQLGGGLDTFNERLDSLDSSFSTVLRDANITLSQRIDLERQLAEETLSFLKEAQEEITSAGLGVFGQTSQENNALHEGIDGLRYIADQLGGSFEKFLSIEPGDFNDLSNQLLNLPVEFRKNILDALNTLPSTVSVGGFSVDQLKTALGQIGAGVAPEQGLPSIEELAAKQTEQLTKLQDLSVQEAQLQIAAVAAAQQEVELAKAQLEQDKIMRDRAEEAVVALRESLQFENDVLQQDIDAFNALSEAVTNATSEASLNEITAMAEEFDYQTSTLTGALSDVSSQIVDAIYSLASAQAAYLSASSAVSASYRGHIPSYAGGSLSRREMAGLFKAASIEKRHMPAGAGLAVANTSEAIIPTRYKGYIPNYNDGNMSPIAAGVSAAKGVNATVAAAIARSIATSLSEVTRGSDTDDTNRKMLDELGRIKNHLGTIAESSNKISSNTAPEVAGNKTAKTGADVRIELAVQNSDTVQVTGLQSLGKEVESAIRKGKDKHVEETMKGVNEAIGAMHQILRERNAISSLGHPS